MGSAVSRYYGCRPTVIGGGITAALGLACASQATAMWHLYASMSLVGKVLMLLFLLLFLFLLCFVCYYKTIKGSVSCKKSLGMMINAVNIIGLVSYGITLLCATHPCNAPYSCGGRFRVRVTIHIY